MNSGSYKETMGGPIRENDHSQHKKLLDVMPTAVKVPARGDRDDDTIETFSISTGSIECDPQPIHSTPQASIMKLSSRRFSGQMETLICDLKNEQSPKQGSNGLSMHRKSSRLQDLVSPRGVASPITPRGSKQVERYSGMQPKLSPKLSPRGDRRSFLPYLPPVSPSTNEMGHSPKPTTLRGPSRGSPRSNISPRNPSRSARSSRQTDLEPCASSVASPPLSTKSIDWGNGISSSIHEQTETGRGGWAQGKRRTLKSQWNLNQNNLTTFKHEIWPSKTSSGEKGSPGLPSKRSHSEFPPVPEEGSAVVQNASCGRMQPRTKSMDPMHSSDSVLLINPSWLILSDDKKVQATKDGQQSKPESRDRSSRRPSGKDKKKTENDDDKQKRKKRRSKSKLKGEQVAESRSRRCSSNPDLEVGEKTTHRKHRGHGERFESGKMRPKEDTSGKKKRREGEKKQPLDDNSAHRRKDARERLASHSFNNILSSDAPRIVDTKQQVSKSNRCLTSAAARQESRTMREERGREDPPGEDRTLGESRSEDVCPSGEDITEDVSSGEDPLSRREVYQEAILELCEIMEASIPFWTPEELRVRRQVLVHLLQATSERETHLTNLMLEDVSEIVVHVRCLEANCEVEWDIIRDIVFPVGYEEGEEEPLAETTPDSDNHVTTDDQREVLKSFQQSFALSEKELFAALGRDVKQVQTNRPALLLS
jgi:hypothetical protein